MTKRKTPPPEPPEQSYASWAIEQVRKRRGPCPHLRTRPDITGRHGGKRRCIDCGEAVDVEPSSTVANPEK